LLSAEAVHTTAWMPSPRPLLLATRWLEDGKDEVVLKAQLAERRARHTIVTTIRSGHSFSADPRCRLDRLKVAGKGGG
ncbi:hypothetical protein ACC689_36285, partial [Rhizobium ruizarguesonis]